MHFVEAVADAVEAVERIPVVGPMIRIGTEVTGRILFGTVHLVEGGVGLARSALGLGGHDGHGRSMERHRVEVRSGRSSSRATKPATSKRTSKKSTAKKTTRAKRPTAAKGPTAASPSSSTPSASATSTASPSTVTEPTSIAAEPPSTATDSAGS